jgi:hypothetical protein
VHRWGQASDGVPECISANAANAANAASAGRVGRRVLTRGMDMVWAMRRCDGATVRRCDGATMRLGCEQRVMSSNDQGCLVCTTQAVTNWAAAGKAV